VLVLDPVAKLITSAPVPKLTIVASKERDMFLKLSSPLKLV
jgi:hypothetical protein